MLKHLLKKEYPSLRKADYEKAVAFIDGKCSQYYFLDYMRATGGNVDDAIEFYLLDDGLRSLLAQYLSASRSNSRRISSPPSKRRPVALLFGRRGDSTFLMRGIHARAGGPRSSF